jgi:8-oxo-dGTP pyrophosphatase MutT (NUDIX family)
MHFDTAVARLENGLGRPLPGEAAHGLLLPKPRRPWPEGFDPARIRHAAGLLLVFPLDGRAHIVLTLRASTLERHSGQVSLPGGAVEPGETFEHAALREATEEIALPPGAARVLGPLTPLDIPVSGFRLHPLVAVLPSRQTLRPADGEVAAVLEIAVADLLSHEQPLAISRERDGQRIVVPTLRAAGVDIWGATAMILAEFLVLLGWTPTPRSGDL